MQLPEIIDITRLEDYNLSIRICSKGLSFVIHQRENAIFYFQHIPFEGEMSQLEHLQKVIFEHNFLTHAFIKTDVIIVSKNYEFIPYAFFDTDRKESLFALTHSNTSGQVLVSSDLADRNVTLFELDVDVYQFLVRSLYNPSFHHHANLLVTYFWGKHRLVEAKKKMYLNFCDETVNLFCYRNNNFFQAITHQNLVEEDLIYEILNLWEKAQFDQLTDVLYISGSAASSDAIVRVLKTYIKHCEKLNAPTELSFYGENIKNVSLDLLTLTL